VSIYTQIHECRCFDEFRQRSGVGVFIYVSIADTLMFFLGVTTESMKSTI
jgi:hypothetical protein